MHLTEALNVIQKNPALEDIALSCSSSQKNEIHAIFEQGLALKNVTIQDAVLHRDFTTFLLGESANHTTLQSLQFKDCLFDGDASADAFKNNLPKCFNLRHFGIDTIASDDDLAAIISGLVEQGKLERLTLDLCLNIGGSSISAISQLISLGVKPITLEISNSNFSNDLTPIIQACQKLSRQVTWKLIDAESAFNHSQLEILRQLRIKEVSQGSNPHGFHSASSGDNPGSHSSTSDKSPGSENTIEIR